MSAIRFLADEDFDNRIFRGLLRRLPHLDLVRVQDTEVAGGDDPMVLQWAAVENRVILAVGIDEKNYDYFQSSRVFSSMTEPSIY